MFNKKARRPRRMNRSAPRRRIDINADAIDFRNVELLRKFITERGKILPRRVTGMPAVLHRRLNQAIKRARNALLLK
ncbi:MAG: 30S ribosomal protein S18 [Verrucomicrobia bacterium]|jgi:small subunit ribosomal protein S18|nr:30S ribosomal protein S18 [Verrucomicrobiota bacterium]NCY22090.1 30S ribosomal protein S18 [bacterium]NBR69215.1 30S ribosomal protein S18 [Verrucomicrobiota bacterium]NBS14007.1 30S ribosomal protein S18 [Verrucomicrobiota bacterium]NBS83374.1 30S ribosomal protein S18 [Verrucomicrobiota bacterium]